MLQPSEPYLLGLPHCLLLPNNIPLSGFSPFCLSTHPLTHAGLFPPFGLHEYVMDIWVQVFLGTYVFNSLASTPMGGIARDDGIARDYGILY